jgi:hypothetical protein
MQALGAALGLLAAAAAAMVVVAVVAIIATVFLSASLFTFLYKFNYLTKENFTLFLVLIFITLLIVIAFQLFRITLKKGLYCLNVIMRQPHFENVVLPQMIEKEKLLLNEKLKKFENKKK